MKYLKLPIGRGIHVNVVNGTFINEDVFSNQWKRDANVGLGIILLVVIVRYVKLNQ